MMPQSSINNKSWFRLFHRPLETNKYDFGHVLIIGGSEEMTGAPILAARAALRTGTGLVTIASTNDATRLIDRDIEELMTLSLPSWDRVKTSIDIIMTFIKRHNVTVVVIGPGLPLSADEMIRTLIPTIQLPMVLDAEVFKALSGYLPILQSATGTNKDIILTPHSGEYAGLTKDEPSYDTNNGQDPLKKFTRDYNVTVVFKQHRTLIVSPKGQVYENTTGNPGLATAGTGDVLTGLIAGMLAQKIEPYEAAQMAVYLHGLAGDMATQSNTEPSVIASDIIDFLPKALKNIELS